MSKVGALTLALGLFGLAPAAPAAWVDTGWVKFDLRSEDGNTYVYPRHADGSLSYVLAGNCQFNGLVLTGADDRFSLHGMLMTAREQGLRVSLRYDDTGGPVCRLAQLHIEWAD